MVKEIFGVSDFERECNYKGLVVVDFFTTWCGPCKMIAPILESLAVKYPEVRFIKVDIEKNPDIAGPRRISSIPTFHFLVNGRVVDEMKGANPGMIEQKINQYKVNLDPFASSSGYRLSHPMPEHGHAPLDAREARLRALGMSSSGSVGGGGSGIPPPNTVPMMMSPPSSSSSSQPQPNNPTVFAKAQDAADQAEAERMITEFEKKSHELTIITDPSTVTAGEGELVPIPVDQEILTQLLEMGFTENSSRKAIYYGKTLEEALAWIEQHQEDPEMDTPYYVKKSDTAAKPPPMTEQEKQQKIQEMKLKIKARREEQLKQEKQAEIEREKQRREQGKLLEESQSEKDRMMKKLEYEKKKKEKEAALKERERIRAEIARDKEIRKKNDGRLV